MNVPFLKSLRFRMPLMVLVGIVPIVSIAIYAASDRASETIKRESEENLVLKTELLDQNVASWNESNVLALLNLSIQPDIIGDNEENRKAMLSGIVNTYDHLYLAMTIGLDGVSITRSDNTRPKEYGDREYFRSALEGNRVSYQTLISRTSDKPAICMASPIEREGQIQGVTAICTDLKVLTEQVGQLKFGESGYAFVVDEKGDILVHPNLQYLSGAEVKNFSQYPPVKNILEDKTGILTFEDSRGVKWVSYSSRLDNGFGVVVLQEEAEFFKNKREFQKLAFIIGFVAVVGVSGLTVLLANRLTGPIVDLSGAAISIANGRLDRRVKIKGENELGVLGSSFNQMASQLQTSFEDLKQAKETAVAANNAKDRFIANISHELRTPLNGILGYTKLLQRELVLNQQQAEEFKIVEKSGKHLLTLINDLLDFSKNQANKMELHSTEVNLGKFIKEVIGIVQNEAKEKGLEIITKVENIPNKIEADEKRLQQVLLNLLNNAIKFTDRGQVVLRVSGLYEATTKGKQKIRFEVIDTGIGISKKEQEKIFQPFEQTGDASMRNVGTGLGLSISSQLVELMGGKLQVKSQLGKGSKFWFEAAFTIVKEENYSVSPRRKKVEIENILGYKGPQRHILVVDDKQANRWLLVNILEPIGFKVTTAEDGEDMFKAIATEKPDLICLDLFMPKKTGFTSAKQLRSRSELHEIPIVVISATAITEDMRQYLQCDAFLSKPLDENELLTVLQEFLDLEWTYRLDDYMRAKIS